MRDIYLCKDKNYSQKIFLKIKLKIIVLFGPFFPSVNNTSTSSGTDRDAWLILRGAADARPCVPTAPA